MKTLNLIKTTCVTGALVMAGSVFAGEQMPPVEYSKFSNILSASKLQLSDPAGKSGNKKDLAGDSDFTGIVSPFFHVDKDTEALVFGMDGYKNRSELRVLDNFKTNLTDTTYRLSTSFLPINPQESVKNSDKKNDAMTYLQVHNAGSEDGPRGHTAGGYIPHPLLRVVYEAERSGKKDHYWAIIKNNAVNCGSKSGNKGTEPCKKAYIKLDLGPVNTTEPTDMDIAVGNSKLVITRDGETVVDHDISYWSHLNSYFKLGVYNQFKNGASEAHFYKLDYIIDKK